MLADKRLFIRLKFYWKFNFQFQHGENRQSKARVTLLCEYSSHFVTKLTTGLVNVIVMLVITRRDLRRKCFTSAQQC